jgi:hypothetical protein
MRESRSLKLELIEQALQKKLFLCFEIWGERCGPDTVMEIRPSQHKHLSKLDQFF